MNNLKIILITIFFLFSCTQTQKYSVEYYDTGEIKEEGLLFNGYKQGLWRLWYKNGYIKAVGHFVKDKPNGKWVFWTENGLKDTEGFYVNGRKQGIWKLYDNEDGSLGLEIYYVNGDVIKEVTYSEYGNKRVIEIRKLRERKYLSPTKVIEQSYDTTYYLPLLGGDYFIEYDPLKEKFIF